MRLKDGDAFPGVSVQTLDGGNLRIPGDLKPEWNAVLYYRGTF